MDTDPQCRRTVERAEQVRESRAVVRLKTTPRRSPGFTPIGCTGASESAEKKPAVVLKLTAWPPGRFFGVAPSENSTRPAVFHSEAMPSRVPSSK